MRRLVISGALVAIVSATLAASASAQNVGSQIGPPKLQPGGVVTVDVTVYCFEATTFLLAATLTQGHVSETFTTPGRCETRIGERELLEGHVLVVFDPAQGAFRPGSAFAAFTISHVGTVSFAAELRPPGK